MVLDIRQLALLAAVVDLVALAVEVQLSELRAIVALRENGQPRLRRVSRLVRKAPWRRILPQHEHLTVLSCDLHDQKLLSCLEENLVHQILADQIDAVAIFELKEIA